MSEQKPPRDDAAMADILASIRRIVSEEEQRVAATSTAPPGPQGEILELTADMRVDGDVSTLATAAHTPRSAAVEPDKGATAAKTDVSAPASIGDAVEIPPSELSVDEAHIVEIVRAVLRDELEGELGVRLSRTIREISQEEITRAFEAYAADE